MKGRKPGSDRSDTYARRWQVVLVVISLDNHHSRQGFVQLPLDELGIAAGQPLLMRDVIPNVEYTWDREWNFVELHPNMPFHIFEINQM